MKKIKSKKGFTLMEMLIVVAIIAILVAIAIPTFTTQLTKARCAADNANVRAAYSEAMSEYLTTQAASSASAGTMQEAYDGTTKIGDLSLSSGAWAKGDNVSVSVTDAGVASISK